MSARCSNCAAPATQPGQVYCAFCGTPLPRVEPPPPPRPPSVAELLAEVERHPDLPAWRAHRPSGVGIALGLGSLAVFGVAFALIAFVLLMFFSRAVHAPGAFGLVPLVFVVAGLALAISAGRRAARFASAPLQRVPALIVDERTEVSGGGRNSSASTDYYATLEGPDGKRVEYRIGGRLAGAVAPGDYGLAFLRAGVLLDFRRVGSR